MLFVHCLIQKNKHTQREREREIDRQYDECIWYGMVWYECVCLCVGGLRKETAKQIHEEMNTASFHDTATWLNVSVSVNV